jgi:hypothetical protein
VKNNKKNLRAKWLDASNFADESLEWMLETPYDLRNQAMTDLLKVFKDLFLQRV